MKKFLRYSGILSNHSYNTKADWLKTKHGTIFNIYISPLMHKLDQKLYDEQPLNKVKNYSGCLYDNEEKLENWKYYILTNKLPLALSYMLSINQNNVLEDYCPYIVDDRYSDEEIYGFLNFTKEEIELIEHILTKFNMKSNWFKRFKEGKNYKKICDETQ